MNSRLDLAWFLFLQGVACSGQISSHGPNGDSAEFTLSTEGSKLGELPQIGAQELFRAALHETISVEHLGRDSHLQLEIERLHSLARLLGGSKLLDERAREAIQIQMRLFYDLSDSEENEGDEEEPMLE